MPLRLLIPALFFLSGTCSLIYQVVWARMLIIVFGTTLLAVSTVLSTFMAGLALGSFVFGRWIDRIDRPLLVFAALEIGVGLFALLFPLLNAGLESVYAVLAPFQGNVYLFSLVRFALCFLLLLLPTMLMGATLPVITKAMVRQLDALGGKVGRLYAANTCGAVLGVLTATFILMEWLGLRGSAYAAAAINFCIAALAWGFGRNFSVVAAGKDAAPSTAPRRKEHLAPVLEDRVLRVVLLGFALSGFAALGYEVAWTRLLIVTFSVISHYEFSIVLIAFLVGLALGSWLCSRFLDGDRDLLSLFGIIELLIGVCGILSIAVLAALPDLIGLVQSSHSWWTYRGGILAVSFLVMLPPTVLMGATYPLVSRIYTRRLERVGRGLGTVGAVNSLGAVGGAFVTGFLLMPVLGTEWSVKTLAALNIAAGLAALSFHPTLERRHKQRAWAGSIGLLILLLALVPSDILRQSSKPSSPRRKLVFFEESAEGVITVQRQDDGYREMRLNGGGQVPTDYGAMQIFRILGHLPMALHPDPQDVLVIALGGGITLGSVAQHDVDRIHCVELVPEVITAARQHYSEFNYGVLDDPSAAGIELIVDDGRNYLLSTSRTYDVITGDATHPTSADSWVLYTRDFYELCRAHLQEGGIMVQWLPYHGLPVEDYKTILRTFQSVFPHATLWRTNNFSLMAGSLEPLAIDFPLLERRLAVPRVRRSLDEADLGDPFSLLSCFFMDAETLRRYVGTGPLNTDDHPYISFVGPRGFGRGAWEILSDIEPHQTSVLPLLTNLDQSILPANVVEAKLGAYLRSKAHGIKGDIWRLNRKKKAAAQAYQQALRENPEDGSAAYYYDLLIKRLMRQQRRSRLP